MWMSKIGSKQGLQTLLLLHFSSSKKSGFISFHPFKSFSGFACDSLNSDSRMFFLSLPSSCNLHCFFRHQFLKAVISLIFSGAKIGLLFGIDWVCKLDSYHKYIIELNASMFHTQLFNFRMVNPQYSINMPWIFLIPMYLPHKEASFDDYIPLGDSFIWNPRKYFQISFNHHFP